ncbi:MAG TPA: hypothetical protein V6D11_10375 [Waterburya sp.]
MGNTRCPASGCAREGILAALRPATPEREYSLPCVRVERLRRHSFASRYRQERKSTPYSPLPTPKGAVT